jgi:hypothetical protein
MGKPWADKDRIPYPLDDGDPDGGPCSGTAPPYQDQCGEEIKKSPSSESGTSNMQND